MIVTNGRQEKTSIRVYQCAYHKQRGPEVCDNSLRRPLTRVNERVLGWLKSYMTPEFVFRLVADLRAERRDGLRARRSVQGGTADQIGPSLPQTNIDGRGPDSLHATAPKTGRAGTEAATKLCRASVPLVRRPCLRLRGLLRKRAVARSFGAHVEQPRFPSCRYRDGKPRVVAGGALFGAAMKAIAQ
jgi:hypothetical protein